MLGRIKTQLNRKEKKHIKLVDRINSYCYWLQTTASKQLRLGFVKGLQIKKIFWISTLFDFFTLMWHRAIVIRSRGIIINSAPCLVMKLKMFSWIIHMYDVCFTAIRCKVFFPFRIRLQFKIALFQREFNHCCKGKKNNFCQ